MSKRERDVAAAPASSTPLVEARASLARVNRERCYRMQLRQLNVAFARAVEENAGSSGSLENEVRQYMRFARQLTESFRDVLQPAAPAPPRGGSVYVVGTGDFGQLGLGDEVLEKSRPVLLDGFGAAPVIALACGGMHSLALDSEGQVYSWGVNDEGALGREARPALCSLLPCSLAPAAPRGRGERWRLQPDGLDAGPRAAARRRQGGGGGGGRLPLGGAHQGRLRLRLGRLPRQERRVRCAHRPRACRG